MARGAPFAPPTSLTRPTPLPGQAAAAAWHPQCRDGRARRQRIGIGLSPSWLRYDANPRQRKGTVRGAFLRCSRAAWCSGFLSGIRWGQWRGRIGAAHSRPCRRLRWVSPPQVIPAVGVNQHIAPASRVPPSQGDRFGLIDLLEVWFQVAAEEQLLRGGFQLCPVNQAGSWGQIDEQIPIAAGAGLRQPRFNDWRRSGQGSPRGLLPGAGSCPASPSP